MRSFTLVGIVHSPNYPSAALLDYLNFYASSSDIKKLLGTAGSNTLLLKFNDVSRSAESVNATIQILDRRGLTHTAPIMRDPANYAGKRELAALLNLLT